MPVGVYINTGDNNTGLIPIRVVDNPGKTPSDSDFSYEPINEIYNLDTTFL